MLPLKNMPGTATPSAGSLSNLKFSFTSQGSVAVRRFGFVGRAPYIQLNRRGTACAAGNGAPAGIANVLEAVKDGSMSLQEGVKLLSDNGTGIHEIEDLASLDTGRFRRTGEPEVILGIGKTPEQLASIMMALAEDVPKVLVTRVPAHVAQATMELLKSKGVDGRRINYCEAPYYTSQVLTLDGIGKNKMLRLPGIVTVVTGGVADQRVLDECMDVGRSMGMYMAAIKDISVDGIQRAIANVEALRASQVIIVISGGDGALVPVIAGLVRAPIIAVPTSTGYGAAKEGFTALNAALCSSSPGVAVQNIDNGFGAAMYARRIMYMINKLVQQALAQSTPDAASS